jgi:hypothetical protein
MNVHYELFHSGGQLHAEFVFWACKGNCSAKFCCIEPQSVHLQEWKCWQLLGIVHVLLIKKDVYSHVHLIKRTCTRWMRMSDVALIWMSEVALRFSSADRKRSSKLTLPSAYISGVP